MQHIRGAARLVRESERGENGSVNTHGDERERGKEEERENI